MHPDLEEALAFHEAILAEGSKALVGYDRPKQLANVVLLSEIPTTYDKKEQRQVSSGNLLLRGVPGVGKTFFGVILAAISNAKFARLQGRADLQPTEVVGFQMINPATGELITEFGPLAEAEIILLDEINRIPLKSQSAFLEGLQDRTVTVGKTTYELPAFSFAIATMNPVELGQGTFPLSEAATDRFAIIVNIGYLPPEEERKLVNFDFKRIRLNPLMAKERIIELRAAINQHVFLHESLGDYIQRLVAATRPYNPEIDWRTHSPSELVERGVDLGASPRAIICWGRLAKAWALAGASPRCGLSRGHPGPRAVRARPPHLARTARRQPRPDDRSRHRRRHPAGPDSVRSRSASWTGDERDGEPLDQPVRHHRDRAAHPEADARVHDRRSREPISRVGLRLRRAARMAGGRPLLVDRLAAVVAHQLQPAHRSASSSSQARRASSWSPIDRCRPAAASTACRSRRRSRGHSRRIGMSAVFFQDSIGLVTFDHEFTHLQGLRPRIGKGQVIHCLDAYQYGTGLQDLRHAGDLGAALGGFMRKTSMVPVISDFLFDNVDGLVRELVHLNSLHDVFLAHRRRVVRVRACQACRPAGSRRSTWRAGARA